MNGLPPKNNGDDNTPSENSASSEKDSFGDVSESKSEFEEEKKQAQLEEQQDFEKFYRIKREFEEKKKLRESGIIGKWLGSGEEKIANALIIALFFLLVSTTILKAFGLDTLLENVSLENVSFEEGLGGAIFGYFLKNKVK